MDLVREVARTIQSRRWTFAFATLASSAFVLAIGFAVASSARDADTSREALDRGISTLIEIRSTGLATPVDDGSLAIARDLDGVLGVVFVGPLIDVSPIDVPGERVPAAWVDGDLAAVGLEPCNGAQTVVSTDPSLIARSYWWPGVGTVTRRSHPAVPLLGTIGVRIARGCSLEGGPPRRAIVVAAETSAVPLIVEKLNSLVASRTDVVVVSDADLVEFRTNVAAELAERRKLRARNISIAFVLGLLLFHTSSGVFSRSDIGRRRALGASRSTASAIVLLLSVAGAAAGTVLALLLALASHLWIVQFATRSWVVPSAAMAILASMLGSLPAVVFAAVANPISVLRSP